MDQEQITIFFVYGMVDFFSSLGNTQVKENTEVCGCRQLSGDDLVASMFFMWLFIYTLALLFVNVNNTYCGSIKLNLS